MGIARVTKIGAVLVLSALLSACGKPLPEDKQSYAGEWRSAQMVLIILEDGTVSYKRLRSGATTTVNGPIKEFRGDDIVVGLGLLTTTFVVSTPPREVDGQWEMVVDGVLLRKVP